MGDDFLGRIGVLDDEVAGVARHHYGLQFTLSAAADFDHLVGSDEMVFYPLAAVGAGGFRLYDDGFKMAVVHVGEHARKVAAGPIFVARRVGAADGFKRGDFLAHVNGASLTSGGEDFGGDWLGNEAHIKFGQRGLDR